MAGHSKWKNIQHRKGAQDKKRGKLFTKALKEVAIAVKTGGGGDPEANPRLRAAIQACKACNVPKDNIERAIKKAAGAGSEDYLETTFECYGPDGVAIFVECATDNKTRTVSNIRSCLHKHGGSVGKDGCLQFIFEQKGVFTFRLGERDHEELTLELIDEGVEDVDKDEDLVTVTCGMENFGAVQKALAERGIETEESSLQRLPMTTKDVSKETFEKVQKMIDILEDDDDVQKVYHNVAFSEELFT